MNTKEQLDAVKNFFGILTPREWLRSGGIALGCLLIITLSIVLVFGPQTRRLSAVKKETAELRNKSQSYKYFDEFASKMEQQRIKVESVIEGSNVDFTLGEKNDQNFLDEIGRICKEAFIKLENINPVENGRWKISFSDNFQKTINFMSLIEKDFKIESYAMVSGEMKREHKVEMTISPLRFTTAGASDTDDFMDLFEKTNAVIANIEKRQSEKKVYPALAVKDPMYYGDTIVRSARPQRPAAKESAAEEPPPVTIEGIYYDPSTPVVVIDGRAMGEGETIRGVRVVKINEKSVVVNWRSRSFTLRQKGGSE